jgi:hypothetical protein
MTTDTTPQIRPGVNAPSRVPGSENTGFQERTGVIAAAERRVGRRDLHELWLDITLRSSELIC